MASASLWRPPMAGRAVKVPRHATTWPGNARTCTPCARRPTAPSMAAVQLEPTCRPQRFLSTEQHELAEVSVRKLSAVAVGLQEGSNKQAGGLVVHRVGQVQPGGSCQRNFWPAISAPAPRWRQRVFDKEHPKRTDVIRDSYWKSTPGYGTYKLAIRVIGTGSDPWSDRNGCDSSDRSARRSRGAARPGTAAARRADQTVFL